ncbi:acetyltransferase (GNAT) family protein [Rhodobacter sp. JA431]|uniref:GNAT family N-acetyltransferase n=1 Tax=Rhodobacter sp. JA431 TaxID=570013 RepID=UPI000BDCB7CE|nr:GNAT family N-acetyltransferase [Rhodobacter sp. JA431]SOB91931.1 acetyltransferase (GNAT) family protein [Rhodobacter sp. JA431]
MTLTITPVTEADRADWEALFRAYADFYKTEARAAEPQVWEWIQSETEPYWADIARDETGQALGLVQYSLMHRSLSGGMVVYLSDLFTVPQARGKGVGRALIDHVRAFARDRGYSSVRWLTAENNEAARKLYDSYAPASGFILYSVAP